jgi:sec-independent protein translocase protein TatA
MELGSGEILVILILALLIYGGRLPEVARAIGKSFGELKRGFAETKDAVATELRTDLDVKLDDEPARDVKRGTLEQFAKEDISSPEPPAAHRPHENPN